MSHPAADPAEPARHLRFHHRLAEIDAAEWNGLLGTAPMFMRHEFLNAMETTGCVAPATGWEPRHAALYAGERLLAAMPLYDKYHSWGEFVFDWAWANAYERAGLAYYPKCVSAAPFTPAAAPRLLGAADDAAALLARVLEDCAAAGRSSLHLQFVDAATLQHCRDAGLKIRKDCQFHWRNRGYASFDEFLGQFSSAKRKKVRRERRRVREHGVTFRHLGGADMDEARWALAWALTRRTFNARGNEPYLSLEFFVEAARQLPQAFHVIFAEFEGQPIAAAVCLRDRDTLYGRYWGALARFHSLHFETCYYQGIDFCIEAGLATFEPGTQGEHKISRGFLPVETYSAHWLNDPRFADAIEDYLERESDHIERYIEAVHEHTPFRTAAE